MKKTLVSLFATSLFLLGSVNAALADSVAPQQAETLKAAIKKARPGVTVGEIRTAPVAGLFEVDLGKDTVYMPADGKYLISGTMYRVEANRFVNIADERLQPMRAQKLATVKKEDMIIYSPTGKTKSYVTVFTDIDCGFCRKLHKEIPALNEMGIEVRYLAFPRAGYPSPSADKLATAWCSKNPGETLTKLKSGESVANETCAHNPVGAQYKLGNELGVNGTPALFKPNGEMLPGYMPAAELAAALGITADVPPPSIKAAQ
jgi:thiol:disulfide interchange protein DsbC